MQRPTTSNSRPAHLERMFSEGSAHAQRLSQQSISSHGTSPSLHSSHSSISSAFDFRTAQPLARPLSPAFEEEQSSEDHHSVRSLRLTLSPRHRIKALLNRRTYPRVKETIDFDADEMVDSGSTRQSFPSQRRPSPPKLQTSFSTTALPQKSHRRSQKPLPPPPRHQPEELSCKPCYYFHARNCNGYVLGGSHGDACDGCAQAGFFGAP